MATGLEMRRVRELHIIGRLFWLIFVIFLSLSVWFGYKYFESGELPPFVSARGLSADDSVSQEDISDQDIKNHSAPPNEPKYISVPSLSQKQYRIFGAELDETNQLTLQPNIYDISWYKKSSTPGLGYGAPILSGHGLGVKNNGLFEKATGMKAGDEIIIERGDGNIVRYRVATVEVLPIEQALTIGSKIMSMPVDGTKEGLNIIAPAGAWVPKYQQFNSRVIVRAVLKS